MAGLDSVLTTFGDTGAVLSKGVITAVQTGTVTVALNGGTFERVTVLKGSWVPAVNEQVILLGQADFGMVALGCPQNVPAPPAPPVPTSTVVDPASIANWQNGVWVATLGPLVQAKDGSSAGVWFYSPAELVFAQPLGSVEMELVHLGGEYPELVLHDNAGPVDTFAPQAEPPVRLSLPVGTAPSWVPLPLSWGRALLDGTARGIAASSRLYDATLDIHGSLRFTSL